VRERSITSDATDPFGYLAVYRAAPVSAVTHYPPRRDSVKHHDTRVVRSARDTPGLWRHGLSKSRLGGYARVTDRVEPFSDTDPVGFELGDLVALDSPVENDMRGVRGAWYCTRSALEEATALSELAASDGGRTEPTGPQGSYCRLSCCERIDARGVGYPQRAYSRQYHTDRCDSLPLRYDSMAVADSETPIFGRHWRK
jgi:hypothetical protein